MVTRVQGTNMSIYIKNVTGSEFVIRGVVIPTMSYVQVNEGDSSEWYTDDSVFSAINEDKILVAKSDDGSSDITSYTDQWAYLGDLLPNGVSINNTLTNSPFAEKTLPDGSKLFRRKHGKKETILANSFKDIVFTAPYAKSKINKLEIIGANDLDRVDLSVYSPLDPATAAAYGMPANILLNQFGFDVVVSSWLYSDKSDYDADVYAGFQIIVRYKNDTANDVEVGFNLIYHEVV